MKNLKWIIFCVFLAAAAGASWWLWRYYQAKSEEKQDVWSLAVLGDSEGINPTFEQILQELEHSSISILVDVADVTHNGDKQELQAVLDRLHQEPYPTQVVIGNDDLGPSSQPDSTNFEQLVRSPTYASLDIRNAHLVLLDNADRRVGFSNEELDWLEIDLQHTTQPIVFLFMHRPINVPFTGVIGTDETSTSEKSIQRFLEILATYPVDHIFTGHLETFLQYDVNGIPITVTGGAHARPDQTGFGVSLPSTPHYVLVTIRGQDIEVEKVDVQ